MNSPCATCNDTGTHYNPNTMHGSICLECRVVVHTEDLLTVARHMETYTDLVAPTPQIVLEVWRDQLRLLAGEKVDITPLAQGKLDAIVDAHDRAVTPYSEIEARQEQGADAREGANSRLWAYVDALRLQIEDRSKVYNELADERDALRAELEDAKLAARYETDVARQAVSAMNMARADLTAIRAVVDEQAKDDGLWFDAVTAPEAFLQQELRRLHAAVDGKKP